MTQYWLMKSEPDVLSIDGLKNLPKATSPWDGVRNYQARNNMKAMKSGDKVLFYHSSCEEIGVAGVATVAREAYPDYTSWDPKSKYFDEKSTPENPRWFMVDLKWQKSFKHIVSLAAIKKHPDLAGMSLVKKGQRLSVMAITQNEFETILSMGR